MGQTSEGPSPVETASSPGTASTAPTRKPPGRGVVAMVLVLFAVAVLGLAFLGYQAFQKRLTAARGVDDATELIERADVRVTRIDAVVRARLAPGLEARARGAADTVPVARKGLEDAVEMIDEAMTDLTEDERERATLLRQTAEARLGMLAKAPSLLEVNAQAASAMPLAQAGWDAVIEADSLSDKATKSYNKLTAAGVKQSRVLNRQAEARLAIARDRFDAAERAFPPAPFETYLAYVNARSALNRISQQSDSAWLSGRIEQANKLAEQYNSRDKQAAEQAKGLPESPDAAVAEALTAATEDAEREYFAARDRALEADKRLRNY